MFRPLKDRFNEHRRTIDIPNNKSKPTTAAEHFLSSPNHTANDMILIPIEKKNLLQPREKSYCQLIIKITISEKDSQVVKKGESSH